MEVKSIARGPKGVPLRSLVTGATGFIGRQLLATLERPVVLTRNAEAAKQALSQFHPQIFEWHPERSRPPSEALEGVDVVYHLAGESVSEGRWTAEKKKRMVASRIEGTQNLVEGLLAMQRRPKVLVAASAVGYYGDRHDEILEETDRPGHGFLPKLCVQWEHEAQRAIQGGIRVVCARIGVVLGHDGGALTKIIPIFQRGLGARLGRGTQYMPWVHVNDVVGLMSFAANAPALAGPINVTSPHPATNSEFTAALAQALRKRVFLPAVPKFLLHWLLGELGSVVLQSQQALPRVAMRAGYKFKYARLDDALKSIVTNLVPQAMAESNDGSRAFLKARAGN